MARTPQPSSKRARTEERGLAEFPPGFDLQDLPDSVTSNVSINFKKDEGFSTYSFGSYTGVLSPLSTVTYDTRKLGLESDVAFFAFAHGGLPSEAANTAKNVDKRQSQSLDSGGFMYFDSRMRLLKVKRIVVGGESLSFWKQHKTVTAFENFNSRFGPGFHRPEQPVAWVVPGEKIDDNGNSGKYGGFMYKQGECTHWAPLKKAMKPRIVPLERQAQPAGPTTQRIKLADFFGQDAGLATAILEFDNWAQGVLPDKGFRLMRKTEDGWSEVKPAVGERLRTIAALEGYQSTAVDTVLVVPNQGAMKLLREKLPKACSGLPPDLGTLDDDCCRRDVSELQPALSVTRGAAGVKFAVSAVPMAVFSVNSNRSIVKNFQEVAKIAADPGSPSHYVHPEHPVRAHMAYMLSNPWNTNDPVFKQLEEHWQKQDDGKPAWPNAQHLVELAAQWTNLQEKVLENYNLFTHMLEQDREKAAVYNSLLAAGSCKDES